MKTTFTVTLEPAASAAAVKAALGCDTVHAMAFAEAAGAADGAAFKAAYPGALSYRARKAAACVAVHARNGDEFVAQTSVYVAAFCDASR